MKKNNHLYDLVILGSGITALSIAYEAICRGLSVCILHKQRSHAATNAAAGMLTPMFEVDSAQKSLMEFCIRSVGLYPDWISEVERKSGLECDYQSKGTMLVALYQDHIAELEQMEVFQHSLGLKTERLSKREVQKREPALGSRLVGALWAKDDHRVNPRKLQKALWKILENTGTTIHSVHELQLEMDGDEICGMKISNEHIVKGKDYLIAEGVWSLENFTDLPLRPVKGQYILVKGLPDLLECTIRTPDVYIVPRQNGQYYLGATMEEEGFREHKTAGASLDLLYHTWQVFRAVYEMEIVEHGVGFRPAMLDNQPIYDRSKYRNVFICTGQYRHGILLAPNGAKLMLDIIQERIECSPFSLNRFA